MVPERVAYAVASQAATPATEDDRFMQLIERDLERERERRRSAEYREYLALLMVIRIAPTIGIAEMLLRGEKVPRSKLDPVWLEAYGL